MYDKPIGIAVLTNSDRKHYLKDTIESFLENCSYRPLVIGIFDNGSTDDTWNYIQDLAQTKLDGVEWRIKRSDMDLGCGPGVNRANEMVKEFEYTFFLESDWLLMREEESGVPKTWMDECLEFMQTGKCDYLYLRRFAHNDEAMFHDYGFVMHFSGEQDGKFLQINKFMYSNNPHLRRTKALYDSGTLPVPEFLAPDGTGLEKKENKQFWGKAEHAAPQPPNIWFRVWGMFLHESEPIASDKIKPVGCGYYGPYGCSTCKYGFIQFNHGFCPLCDASKDYHDLFNHQKRYHTYFCTMLNMRREIMSRVGDMEYNAGKDNGRIRIK